MGAQEEEDCSGQASPAEEEESSGAKAEGEDVDQDWQEAQGARPGRPEEGPDGLQLLPGRLQGGVQARPPGSQGRRWSDQGRERALEEYERRAEAAFRGKGVSYS